MHSPEAIDRQSQNDFAEAMKDVDDYETHMKKDFKSPGDQHIEDLRETYKMTMTIENLPEYQEDMLNRVKSSAELDRINAMGRQYDYMGSVDPSSITREYKNDATADNLQDSNMTFEAAGTEENDSTNINNTANHLDALANRQISRLQGYQEAAGAQIENNINGFDGMLDALDKHSHF